MGHCPEGHSSSLLSSILQQLYSNTISSIKQMRQWSSSLISSFPHECTDCSASASAVRGTIIEETKTIVAIIEIHCPSQYTQFSILYSVFKPQATRHKLFTTFLEGQLLLSSNAALAFRSIEEQLCIPFKVTLDRLLEGASTSKSTTHRQTGQDKLKTTVKGLCSTSTPRPPGERKQVQKTTQSAKGNVSSEADGNA
ncbi:hypothetical protein FOBRF1_011161 [Fusarium oxysporum]